VIYENPALGSGQERFLRPLAGRVTSREFEHIIVAPLKRLRKKATPRFELADHFMDDSDRRAVVITLRFCFAQRSYS
jgi:hypothetical protein